MKKDIAEYVAVCDVCSEGRTSEASRITAAYVDTRMEVGQAWHGFYYRIAQD